MNYLMMMINDLDHEDDLSSRGGAMSSTGGLDLELEAAESASALSDSEAEGGGGEMSNAEIGSNVIRMHTKSIDLNPLMNSTPPAYLTMRD